MSIWLYVCTAVCIFIVIPECVKVLLKYGANPRHMDENETVPLDVAKDDATKAVLHKALRKKESTRDKAGTLTSDTIFEYSQQGTI